MPRRGWTAIATPSGWYDVIRGPQPPSVQWPVSTKGKGTKGQGKGKGIPKPVAAVAAPQKVQGNSKVARLEAALQALGQEQSSARSAVEEALKTAKEEVPKPMHPEQRTVEAGARVQRLEAALTALGENDSDAEPLKAALKQARSQARVRPMGERLDLCLQYVARVKKQVAKAEEQVRAAQEVLRQTQEKLKNGLRDLEVLRAEASEQPERCTSGDGRRTQRGDRQGASGTTLVGTPSNIRRGCSVKESKNISRIHRVYLRPRWTWKQRIRCHVDVDRRSSERSWESRVIRSRYGLRGVRVGEASNPGPPCITNRVSRGSQQSGVSTVPAASNELHAFRRGVSHSELTWVDSSDGHAGMAENRFAALQDPASVENEARGETRRRRLVLNFQQEGRGESDHEWDPDTDSLGGVSEGEAEDVAGPSEPFDAEARVRAPARSFASLDVLNLSELFESRPRLMRSVPHILRGGFRLALRVAVQEILAGVETNSEARAVRGWKLLLVLPRMLLWRPPRGGTVSRKKLEARIRQFQEGDWISLLRQSTVASEQGQNRAVRQRRRNQDEEAARAARALSLVQMGELSAGRQALEGASLAPGNLATLGVLTDPERRPPFPRRALSQEIRRTAPRDPFVLDPVELLICLRKARRGAAAGPSGMTSDHLFPVLENEADSELFVQVCAQLGRDH